MSSPAAIAILKHLNVSTTTYTTAKTTQPLVKSINNNPDADETGLLECGCYDVCHGVCRRFHHKRHLAIHAATWRNNVMTMLERKQLLSDVEDIKEFNTYGSTSQCEHCNTFYPTAFLVYPNEAGAKYTPKCIPCIVSIGLANDKTIRILQDEHGPRKAEIMIQHYYAIARTLIRHLDVPLHHLLSCQTSATQKWFRLDEKYYFFDMNLGMKDDN